jgi:hypothetical protein
MTGYQLSLAGVVVLCPGGGTGALQKERAGLLRPFYAFCG